MMTLEEQKIIEIIQKIYNTHKINYPISYLNYMMIGLNVFEFHAFTATVIASLRNDLQTPQDTSDKELLLGLYNVLTQHLTVKNELSLFVSIIYASITTPIATNNQNEFCKTQFQIENLQRNSLFTNCSTLNRGGINVFNNILNNQPLSSLHFNQKIFSSSNEQENALIDLLDNITEYEKKTIENYLENLRKEPNFSEIVSCSLKNLIGYDFYIFKMPDKNNPCVILNEYDRDSLSIEIRGFNEKADAIVSIEFFTLPKNESEILSPLFQADSLSKKQARTLLLFILSKCKNQHKIPLIYRGFTQQMIADSIPLDKAHYLDVISSTLENMLNIGYTPENILNVAESASSVSEFIDHLDFLINNFANVINNDQSSPMI